MVVFEAAFDGEQGVDSRVRTVAAGSFESAADDLLAGAFHDVLPGRKSAFPVEIVAHSVFVGLVVANQVSTASNRRYGGFRSAMTSSTRPAFSWFLTVFIQSVCLLSRGVTAFTAVSAYWRAWNRSRMKVTSCAGSASSQVLRILCTASDIPTNSSDE